MPFAHFCNGIRGFTPIHLFSAGVSVLLSGMVDEDDGIISVSHIIIPAFVSALSALQPHHYPFPPDPNVYAGNYSVDVPGFNFTIIVTADSGQLTLSWFARHFYLAYQEPYRFQVNYKP